MNRAINHSMTSSSFHRLAPLLAAPLFSLLTLLPVAAQAERVCALSGSGNSAIESLCTMREGMAGLKIRDAWGFVDKAGKVAIDPRFEEVQDFAEGRAGAQGKDKQWGFIDKAGQWAVKPLYEDVEMFSGGMAAAKQNGKWGYIDRDGRWIVAPAYESAGPFRDGNAIVSEGYRRDLMIDMAGKVIKRFGGDLLITAYPNPIGLYPVKQSFRTVLQHRDGRRLPLPEAVPYATEAGDGLLVAEKKELRGGKDVTLKGAVDLEGRWVTPPLFKTLELFREGLAVASPAEADEGDGRYGIVDRQGKFVVPAEYGRIEREKQGWYVAFRPGGGARDFFDARGKRMGEADCGEASQAQRLGSVDRLWTVFVGCGRVWVLHPRAGLIENRMVEPDVTATDDHLLLVDQERDGEDTAEGEPRKALRFALFDTTGKRVFSSDDAQMQGANALRGRYNNVTLLPSGGADSGVVALPLALLIEDDKKVRVLTRELRVLSNPQWTYDSALDGYDTRRRDELVEGPLIMKTEQGWGAVDVRGEWVVKPIYAQLGTFSRGVAFARNEEKELVVANDGKTFDFPKDARRFERVAPGILEGWGERDELVRIDVASGKETRSTLPEGVRLDEFHNGLASARAGQLSGLIDRQGRWVVPARFTGSIEAVLEDEKLVGWKTGRFIRSEGGTSTLRGWLSPDGREVAAPDFENIQYDREDGMLRVMTDSRDEGVMTLDGRFFIEPANERVSYLGAGWYALSPRALYGLLDSHGDWAVRPAPFYWDSSSKRPFVSDRRAGETVLFDNRGRLSTAAAPLSLAEDRPEWWWSRTEGTYPNETTAFYGFDFKEKLRVPFRVQSHLAFSEGVRSFAPREQGQHRQIGLMDTQGKVLGLYAFDEIKDMRGGFAMFRRDLLTDLRTAQQRPESRFGYLDRSGKLAIASVFEAAEDFSEERAVVLAKGSLGLIDTRGQLLVHGAWMCGREPILVDRQQKVVWPAEARHRKKC